MNKLFFFIGLVLFNISCKPLERVERRPYSDVVDMIEEKVQRNANLDFSLERIRIEIKSNKTLNAGGKLYIIKNQCVYMSVQYFGLEIARILVTEDSVKFVNRAERRYLFISMNDLQNKYYKDISLVLIQNLLITGILLPDNVKIRRHNYFIRQQDNSIILEPYVKPGQNFKFVYNNELLLNKIHYLDQNNSLFINADLEYNKERNPDKIITEFVLKSNKYKVEMNLGKIENKKIQIPEMRINDSYSEIIF